MLDWLSMLEVSERFPNEMPTRFALLQPDQILQKNRPKIWVNSRVWQKTGQNAIVTGSVNFAIRKIWFNGIGYLAKTWATLKEV